MKPDQLLKAIEQSRKAINEHNPRLAIFILRDLPEVKSTGLDDYAWAMYQNGTTEYEVEDFIKILLERVKNE